MTASKKEELLLQGMLNTTVKQDHLYTLAQEIEIVHSKQTTVTVSNTQVDDCDTDQPLPTTECVQLCVYCVLTSCTFPVPAQKKMNACFMEQPVCVCVHMSVVYSVG